MYTRCINVSGKKIGEEMTVIGIQIGKKGIQVSFSSGEKLTLTEDSFTETPIYLGKKLGVEEFEALLALSEQDEYFNYAKKLLSRDNYTVHDLREKLFSKGASLEVIRDVIARLKELGLLDDHRYAKTYAEDIAELRLLGKNRVLFDLRSRGIAQEILDELEFPQEKELEKACRYAQILDKKYARAPMASKAFKVLKALISRGFDEDTAQEAALASLTANDEAAEQQRLESAYEAAYTRYSRKYSDYRLQEKVFRYLIQKGYSYEQVRHLMDEKEKEHDQ